jgi:hypothetical protein
MRFGVIVARLLSEQRCFWRGMKFRSSPSSCMLIKFWDANALLGNFEADWKPHRCGSVTFGAVSD